MFHRWVDWGHRQMDQLTILLWRYALIPWTLTNKLFSVITIHNTDGRPGTSVTLLDIWTLKLLRSKILTPLTRADSWRSFQNPWMFGIRFELCVHFLRRKLLKYRKQEDRTRDRNAERNRLYYCDEIFPVPGLVWVFISSKFHVHQIIHRKWHDDMIF